MRVGLGVVFLVLLLGYWNDSTAELNTNTQLCLEQVYEHSLADFEPIGLTASEHGVSAAVSAWIL